MHLKKIFFWSVHQVQLLISKSVPGLSDSATTLLKMKKHSLPTRKHHCRSYGTYGTRWKTWSSWNKSAETAWTARSARTTRTCRETWRVRWGRPSWTTRTQGTSWTTRPSRIARTAWTDGTGEPFMRAGGPYSRSHIIDQVQRSFITSRNIRYCSVHQWNISTGAEQRLQLKTLRHAIHQEGCDALFAPILEPSLNECNDKVSSSGCGLKATECLGHKNDDRTSFRPLEMPWKSGNAVDIFKAPEEVGTHCAFYSTYRP